MLFLMPAPKVLRVSVVVCPIATVVTALILHGGPSVQILYIVLFSAPFPSLLPFPNLNGLEKINLRDYNFMHVRMHR